MLLIINLLLITGCEQKADQIIIIENGEAKVTICVSKTASEEVLFAADELQEYMKKATEVIVPIKRAVYSSDSSIIYIGFIDSFQFLGINGEDLGREGFKIKTKDRNLIIAGKDETGIQYAVYSFLEKYIGVRWFWPGELGEVIPERKTISIGKINDTEEPDYKWRNRGPGGALWGASTGPTDKYNRERILGVSAEHQAEVALWEKRNKWGGMKIFGGHALGEIFVPEKYAKNHPEYYALVDGKRDVPDEDYDYKHGCQICTTNPEVIKVAVEWVKSFFSDNPDYDGVHLTMNDGRGFCECKNCMSLDSGEFITKPGIDEEEMKMNPQKYTVITDRIFYFLNQVTTEVQKTHPGKYIVSMAYSRYTDPPKRIILDPFVIPQYCLWSSYKHANIDLKNKHENIAACWADIANRTGIYEYHINGSWPGMHRVVMPYISKSIKFLYKQGIDLYQTQSGDEFAINGLNYYVAGKLLWDTSLDEKKILDDFYRKAFGNAAGPIKRFHRKLQKAWNMATRDGNDVVCSSLKKTRLLELFTPELLTQCRYDLTEARKAVNDNLIRERIEFYQKGFHYTELTVAAVRAAKKLESAGLYLFPLEDALQTIQKIDKEKVLKMVTNALNAWEARNNFADDLKNDYVLPYFWVKYNDIHRKFNPTENLKILLTIINS
jgi:hypothetical protein